MSSAEVHTKQQVAAFYDNVEMISALSGANVHVGYWHDDADDTPLEQATNRMTDLVIERLGIQAGDRVLDIGCGLGAPALRLAKAMGVHVTAIATSPALIAEAARRAAETGMTDHVTFELGDGEELTYPSGSFDAVMAIESLVHMNDRPAAFRHIARVLKPGGRLVATDRVQLTTPTLAERASVEAYRRMSFNAPFLPLVTYIAALLEAGLLPTEYLDITDHTLPHYRHMIAQLDRAQGLDAQMRKQGAAMLSGLLTARLPTNMLITAQAPR
ncbi:SAM-dependent methyltransferase [Streptomyces kanamyceticus]|uniref:Methyltransferase domain-containing protein n=1 Tax=Streptomyces kanamyceticus TaxID=1967 RepID=A0A5J6GSG3_STRKN|nr:methyltransferase domain-containing protein [Streptomyces kanamyceticus]QEU96935.1 methyltransferase domain-containing protein [Streptomyces kanamyceticus]